MRLLPFSTRLGPHGYREPPKSGHLGSSLGCVHHDAARKGVCVLADDSGRSTGGR